MHGGHEELYVDRPLPRAVEVVERAESLYEGSANQIGSTNTVAPA
jgi:hypothetical protein